MSRIRFRAAVRRAGAFAAFLLLLGLAPRTLTAGEPASWPLAPKPLVVIQSEQPAKLAKHLLRYAQLPELARFPAYREFLDSTAQRRFRQLLSYLEKELGCTPEEMLNRVAGNGVVFTFEMVSDYPFAKPGPMATLLFRGNDPEFTMKALALLTEIGSQELARQESKERYQYFDHQGVKITALNGQFAMAQIGADVVFSNALDGVKKAISRSKKPSAVPAAVAQARSRWQGEPLAWLWSDLKQAKALAGDGFKKAIELPTNDFFAHIVLGGVFDVIRRSDCVAVALHAEGDDLIVTTTLPAGSEGMSPVMKSVFAAPAGEPGVRPFLNVPGALYQQSQWYRPHGFIEHLDAFVTPNVKKEFTDFEKKARFVLVGRKFSDLVGVLGGRHQFVIAPQRETGYQTQPRDKLPAYGGILELADTAKFDKDMLPLLKAGGFLASFNVSMKLTEEQVGEHKLIGYRFNENAKNKENSHGFVFNFSPCLCRVGNQLIAASTFEMARDLIKLTKEEGLKGSHQEEASSRYRFSWSGLGYYYDSQKSQILSSIILGDGSSFEEAEQQAKDLQKLFNRLGTVEAAMFFGKDEFKFELRTRMSEAQAARGAKSEPRTK